MGERQSARVGAHAVHLTQPDWRGQVRCKHCHVVPDAADSPGHQDGDRRAEVTFGGLAKVGVEASMSGDRCSVYCHGAGMHDEARLSPAWDTEGPLGCGDCHAAKQPAPHPEDADCNGCHIDVVDDQGAIINRSLHIDGIIQAPHKGHLPHLGFGGNPRMACTDCHLGDDYHAPLADGNRLDETTICAPCHDDPAVTPADWHDYTWQ